MFNNNYATPFSTQYYAGYMPSYGNYQAPAMQQRPMQQPIQQPAQQPMQAQDIPFREVRYGTLDEAKAHIVMPASSTMFIDRSKSEFYVKSANNMGEPSLETFKYSKIDNNSPQPVSPEIDHAKSVTERDLSNFATHDELKGFLRHEDTKFFVTKEDLKGIETKLDQLQKQINIKNILKGEDQNGK